MLNRLNFALKYALRNMRRDRQRTAFALFSIAAGVATVVALRMLGIMLTDALTDNVRALLRADIRASQNTGIRISSLQNNRSTFPITSTNIGTVNQWATEHNIQVTYEATGELMQTAVVRDGLAGGPAFVQGIFIDPKVYPFYDTINAVTPAGVPLSKLFDGPNQIVFNKRTADQLGIKVGDQVRIGTTSSLYTVKGIVAETSESSFTNPFGLLFGFVYLDRQYETDFGLEKDAANEVFFKIPPNADSKALSVDIFTSVLSRTRGRFWSVTTAEQTLANNKIASDLVSRFVLLLSLVSLVIGGVGIVNTMLVAVNRRATEIAVLKTLGLRGRGVLLIFLVEAVVQGILGSLIGMVLGLGLSVIARSFGEQAFGITLPFRLAIDPFALGLGMGLITTVAFSILPTLMAGQVRPGLVLRQGTVLLARAGCLPLLVSLFALLFGIGSLVNAIIGDTSQWFGASRVNGVRAVRGFQALISGIPVGYLVTIGAFIFIAIAVGITWIFVWLLGRLPSMRNPNLRLAIRGLNLHRGRTALSLLALIIGMSALSGTLILSRSINQLLYTSISGPLGGNVVVLPLPIPLLDTAAPARQKLDTAPGVDGYRDLRFSNGELIAVNGNTDVMGQLGLDSAQESLFRAQISVVLGVNVHGNAKRSALVEGRYLTADDAGKPNIVIPSLPEFDTLGVKVGSTLTYSLGNGKEQVFTVVGIVAPDPQAGLIPISLGDSAVQVPIDMIPKTNFPDLIIASVKPDSVNAAMAVVGTVPGVFVFDVSIFDSLLNRIFSQLAALPLLVAGLSLFAAGVLIATTVSLATLERRRQIGILKALGVKRQQALSQLLIENGIVGVAGGLVSLAPTLLIIGAVPALTENLVHLPIPYDLIALMLGLAVGITLVATLLTAWSASGEAPLAVLRYE